MVPVFGSPAFPRFPTRMVLYLGTNPTSVARPEKKDGMSLMILRILRTSDCCIMGEVEAWTSVEKE